MTATGTIFNIQRFSVHDGPGIRTLVFFKGCALHCAWCSNPESQTSKPVLLYSAARCINCNECVTVCPEHAITTGATSVAVDRQLCTVCGDCARVCPSGALRIAGQASSVEQALDLVQRDAVFYVHSGGGMTLSGGEPLYQPEFAQALLEGARALGIHTAVETCGATGPETVRRVLGKTDLILFDIKHLDPVRHQEWTGMSSAAILANARIAAALGVPMLVRVPVIPGFNANIRDLADIGEFTRELGLAELHLLPYHRFGAPKYASLGFPYRLNELVPPETVEMETFRDGLVKLGLKVRIGG